MLALGRALMSRPKLLTLDEPSMGLAPIIVQKVFQIIRDINQQGVTILLVEQNARAALGAASRGYVMETGSVILEGSAKHLLTNERVKQCYLGIEERHFA
jgi:branched-chain amino acid transport system ATP-binding protein